MVVPSMARRRARSSGTKRPDEEFAREVRSANLRDLRSGTSSSRLTTQIPLVAQLFQRNAPRPLLRQCGYVPELLHDCEGGGEVPESFTESSPDQQRPEYWPVWNIDLDNPNSVRRVAAYVSEHCIHSDDRLRPRGALLNEYQDETAATSVDRYNIITERYERLRELKIPYDHEPFTTAHGQMIRHAQWVLDESGTCLDLTVLLASMCLVSKVVPYLALTYRDRTRTDPGAAHAFPVFDMEREPALQSGRLRHPVTRDAVAGVTDASAKSRRDELLAYVDDGVLVPVDAMRAAASSDPDMAVPIDRAIELGHRCLTDTKTWPRLLLVDVISCQMDATEPVTPLPPPRFGQAIRRFAPTPDTPFIDYPTRKPVLDWLRRSGTGHRVLYGDQGTGKSRLARETLGGTGWFLNASNSENLIRSLAAAEARERGAELTGLESPDVRAFAEQALERLRTAESSWRIVLDNANGAPEALRPWMPHPDAKKIQSVVVTTTNPDWAYAMGTDNACLLKPIDQKRDFSKLREWMQDDAIARLVDGRVLMITALERLCATTGWDTEQLRTAMTRPSIPTTSRIDLAGPTAAWAAMTSAEVFTDDDRAVAHRLAWLPPDDLTSDLYTAIHPAAEASVTRLLALGLLTPVGDRHVALHRLFGEVLRAEQDDATVDAISLELLNDAGVVEALAERGDRETLDLLIDQVNALHDGGRGGRDLGRALAALGACREVHGGVEESARLFERALEHLDPSIEEDALLVADCLHGRARFVNQHGGADEALVRDALGWTEEAARLRAEDEVLVARSRAMEALLLQKLAGHVEKSGKDKSLELYRQAKVTIDESHDLRLGRVDPREESRAVFNKGGVRVKLAQLDDGALAEHHLAEAETAYNSALEQRKRLYRRTAHPHRAACSSGLALVGFYRAVLLCEHSNADRGTWLREATEHAVTSIEEWSQIEADGDDKEVAKIAAILAKIALARKAAVDSRDKGFDLAAFAEDLEAELRRAGTA